MSIQQAMLRLHSSSCDRSWLRAAAALAMLAAMAHALTCEHPCNPDRCPSLAPGQCAYGTVMDSCSCCQECGKGPNQTCGGQGNIEGRCGLGLYCKLRTDLPPDIIPDVPGTCALNGEPYAAMYFQRVSFELPLLHCCCKANAKP